MLIAQSQRQDKNKAQTWERQSAGENPFVRQGSDMRRGGGGDREIGRDGGGGRRGGGGGGRRGR